MKKIKINLSNIEEDELTQEKIKHKLDKFYSKIEKIYDLGIFDIHLEKHHKNGKKNKYSVKAKLETPKRLFVCHKWSWDILSLIDISTKTLEKEIKNKYEKQRDIKRRTDFLSK